MDIYNCLSYKECLLKVLLEKKKSRPQYTFEALSKACGVQKTYLSRVLNHKGNLNEDQLYAAGIYLKFSRSELKFLTTLWRWENTHHPDRKSFYQKKLNELRRQSFKTENKLNVSTAVIAQEILSEYYTDPYFPLIHMFMTLERYQKNPELLKEPLGLSRNKILCYLDRLADMGLIAYVEKKWKILKDTIHLPRASYLIKSYRALMRIKALEKMDQLHDEEYYSFSVAFSSNPEVQKEIQSRFLNFLSDVQKMVAKEKETDVYQMNFDFLKWS